MTELQSVIHDPASSLEQREKARDELRGLLKIPLPAHAPRAAIQPFPSVVKPARVSRQTSLASTRPGGVTADGSARTPHTNIAASRLTPAKTAKTASGPDSPRSTPAASGPSILPEPSTTPVTTFVAVRSSGVSVSAGTSEFCAGRMKVMLIEAIVAVA